MTDHAALLDHFADELWIAQKRPDGVSKALKNAAAELRRLQGIEHKLKVMTQLKGKEIKFTSVDYDAGAEIAKLKADNEKLKALAKFGRRCLDLYSDTGRIDGEAVYCAITEYQLQEDKEMAEPCGEQCKCAYLWLREFPLVCCQETPLAQLPDGIE